MKYKLWGVGILTQVYFVGQVERAGQVHLRRASRAAALKHHVKSWAELLKHRVKSWAALLS